MNKIAIIPARSGSKGLPGKNILPLCGKPMLAWSIEAAKKSHAFKAIIVSTDSKEYGAISQEYGASVIYRNEELSNDSASTYDVIKDVFEKIDWKNLDYFMLLQPTSPLRNEQHIKEAISIFESQAKEFDTLVSLTKAHKASILIQPVEKDLSLKHFAHDFSNYKRQEFLEYEPNGAIFISKINTYLERKHFFGKQGIAYIMDKGDSIDIDDEDDFLLAQSKLAERNYQNV